MTQRADLDVRLQAAVAERDDALARRLADQLVHRRGLEALRLLLQGPLLRLQGEEAVAWLEQLVQLAPAPAPQPAAQLEPKAAAETQAAAEPLREPVIQLPPQLSLGRAAASPAPAPASLAALRAWLPGGHDLPEAC